MRPFGRSKRLALLCAPFIASVGLAEEPPQTPDEVIPGPFVGENVADVAPTADQELLLPPLKRALGENLSEPTPAAELTTSATVAGSLSTDVAGSTDVEVRTSSVSVPQPETHVETPQPPKVERPVATVESSVPEVPTGGQKRLGRESQDALPTDRPYFVVGSVEFRMLAVSDEDPANDRSLLWRVSAGYQLFPGATASLRLGLSERFVAEEGDSAFRFEDIRLGFGYRHELALESIDRSLDFTHNARLLLPTSRQSQARDLIAAVQLDSRTMMEVVPRLSFGFQTAGLYSFHEFAEQAGPEGGMNDQLALLGLLMGEFLVFEEGDANLTVGLDVHSTWTKKYPSRESYESDRSDRSLWLQDYGWDAYLSFGFTEHLALDISLEHGGSVLREGIRKVFFSHRDETELAFAITGRY